MKKFAATVVLGVAILSSAAYGQVPSNAKVLSSCGTAGYPLGFNVMTMDQTGLLCSSATGGGGGGGAVTIASGAVASGAYSSGSIASGAFASGALATGAGTDGWNITEGAKADAAWTSGSGSLVALGKAQATSLATIATNSAGITATPTVTPGAITLVALDISTVTTGATAVTALNSGHRNKGGWIANPSTTTINLCINEITTASGTTSAGSLTCVVPGQTYLLTASTNAVSVVSSDSSHAFSGFGWN